MMRKMMTERLQEGILILSREISDIQADGQPKRGSVLGCDWAYPLGKIVANGIARRYRSLASDVWQVILKNSGNLAFTQPSNTASIYTITYYM